MKKVGVRRMGLSGPLGHLGVWGGGGRNGWQQNGSYIGPFLVAGLQAQLKILSRMHALSGLNKSGVCKAASEEPLYFQYNNNCSITISMEKYADFVSYNKIHLNMSHKA
jgi:hypothetical protein